jgi:hypothetical protein
LINAAESQRTVNNVAYHTKAYNHAKVSAKVQELYGDLYVKNRRGIYEYILGGSTDTKLLMSGSLMRLLKNPFMQRRLKKPTLKKNQTAHIAPLGLMPTRASSVSFLKWTLTM